MFDDPREVECKRVRKGIPHKEHACQSDTWCFGYRGIKSFENAEDRIIALEKRVEELEKRFAGQS